MPLHANIADRFRAVPLFWFGWRTRKSLQANMKNGTQSTTDSDSWTASLAVIQNTIDAIESPIAVVDSAGTILLVNQDWEDGTSIRVDNIKRGTDRIIAANNWDVDAEEAALFAKSLDQLLSGLHEKMRSSSTLPQRIFSMPGI